MPTASRRSGPSRLRPRAARVEHSAMLTKAELPRLRSLREKKTREALGFFIVEGEKVVTELLAAKFPFTEIYATPAWSHAFVGDAAPLPRRIEITPDEMARISHFPHAVNCPRRQPNFPPTARARHPRPRPHARPRRRARPRQCRHPPPRCRLVCLRPRRPLARLRRSVSSESH